MAIPSVLDAHVRAAPTPQAAVDIFKGEWASQFPPPFAELTGANAKLFEDGRIAWAIEQLGGVAGNDVLELGPLEGGHSYMLEKAGAASILGIESNSRAYLKCLIAKELLGMKAANFLLGDFMPFLESTPRQFDLILASGVLYHMTDPLRLLKLIADHSRRTFIITHYYDDAVIKANPDLRPKFPSSKIVEAQGRRWTLYRQEYQAALNHMGFCGGSLPYSHWLGRQELFGALEHLGFGKISIEHDHPHHANGPIISIVASKA